MQQAAGCSLLPGAKGHYMTGNRRLLTTSLTRDMGLFHRREESMRGVCVCVCTCVHTRVCVLLLREVMERRVTRAPGQSIKL